MGSAVSPRHSNPSMVSTVHQLAHEVRVAGGIFQRQSCNKQSLVVEQGSVGFGLVRVGGDSRLQSLEGGVVHIELQNPLGMDGAVGLNGLEILLHLKAQTLAGGEADGMGLQTGGDLDLLDLVAQSFLHKVQSGLVGAGSLLGLLLSAFFNLLIQDGAELLILVGCLLYTSRCV